MEKETPVTSRAPENTLRNAMTFSTSGRILAVGALAAITLTIATTVPALAANATATLTGAGSPAILSSTTPAWVATLTGIDQTPSTTATVDVNDATGTGTGWNLTLSGAVLTSGVNTLAQPSTAAAATFVCDASSTCTVPTSNVGAAKVNYPFTVATTAAKFYSATAATGLGSMTGTNTWSVSVPATAKAGSYAGAWVYSVVSAP
jgi:hypothetical protein